MTDQHDHDHDHVHAPLFASGESMIGARSCLRCGAYVSGMRLQAHAAFHEALASNQGVAPAAHVPAKKSNKKGKK